MGLDDWQNVNYVNNEVLSYYLFNTFSYTSMYFTSKLLHKSANYFNKILNVKFSELVLSR